jgi:hypothetical protein
MDHPTTCIEQLDLAAIQLHQDNPAYRRFALILTDNVVELMCFDRCEDEFGFEDLLKEQGKYGQAKKAEILKGDFAARLNFLRSIDVLTADQQGFVQQAYTYRNESYHTGIVHDDIMPALAWHYHRVACELFVALRRRYVYRHNENVSPAWAKHGGDTKLYWGEEAAYQKVAASLAAARPATVPNLPEALAASILSRIQSVQDALNYLVEDSPDETTEEKEVRDIQHDNDFFEGMPTGPFGPDDKEVIKLFEERERYMKTEWKPKYPRSPLKGWSGRGEKLGKATNPANALQTFAALRREIEPFGEMVFSRANALGAHIDQQVDAAREDRAGR